MNNSTFEEKENYKYSEIDIETNNNKIEDEIETISDSRLTKALIIAQVVSFFISLLGMALFFTEAPADINLNQFLFPFSKKYSISIDIVNRFKSAGTPESFVTKLKSLSLDEKKYSNKKDFKEKLIFLLNFSYDKKWLLNRRFNNLILKIKNDQDGFQLRTEDIGTIETDYNSDITFFVNKLGLNYKYVHFNEIMRPCLDIVYENKGLLINEINRYGNEAAMNLLIDAVCELCKETYNISISHIIRILIALAAALVITCINYESFKYIKLNGWKSLHIILCLIVGLVLSSSSGFVITWILNQQMGYKQELEISRMEILNNKLDSAVEKAYEAYFLYEMSLGSIRELESNKRKLFWFAEIIDKFLNLIRIMETSAQSASAKKHIDTFNKKYSGINKIIEQYQEQYRIIRDNLTNVKGEIEGETGNEGYGSNARRNLVISFNKVIKCLKIFCEQLKNQYKILFDCNILEIPESENTSDKFQKEAKMKESELISLIDKMKKKLTDLIENEKQNVDLKQYSINNSLRDKFKEKYIKIDEFCSNFRTAKSLKEKEYYFDSVLNECQKINGFNYISIKKNSTEGIHQIAIIRLIAMIRTTYFIPEPNVQKFRKILRGNEELIYLMREFNNDIYFSKKKWINHFEERSRINLSTNQRKTITLLLKERTSNFSDWKTLSFAFIFDIVSIILTIILRSVTIYNAEKLELSTREPSQILLVLSNLKKEVSRFNHKWNQSLQRRLGSEKAQQEYKEKEEIKRRLNDFRELIAQEWETYKDSDDLKERINCFIEKEVLAMTMLQIPLKEHNKSLIELNAFNKNLEETFRKNESIRELFKNDMIELQLYVAELKGIKQQADSFLNEIFQEIDASIYDLTKIRLDQKVQSFEKRETNYREKTLKFVNHYKDTLNHLANKMDQYKYRGFFDLLDKKNQNIFYSSMNQIKDALNKIPDKML